jgi:ribosomal protein S18 acetylase RimI-like enzyme
MKRFDPPAHDGMTSPRTTLRAARRSDAAILARVIDLASEGLALHLCSRLCDPGEDPWNFAERQVALDAGIYSWRNGHVAEVDGRIGAGLLSYRLTDAPSPLDALPPVLRPLQALENRVPGHYYINAIGVLPDFRSHGLGRALMLLAERLAEGTGGICLIVADRNLPARRLYRWLGYVEEASEPIVKAGWQCDSENWILMRKPLTPENAARG